MGDGLAPKQERFVRMPTYSATRELLASREDVWAFLEEPNRLADWWPGLHGVQPDRRGLAPGARWRVRSQARMNIFIGRAPDVAGTLVVLDARPPELARWQFVEARIEVELRLAESAAERTRADLAISAPIFRGVRRSLPRKALTRLYALCQTGAQA
jgi:uncharacterized protein YndB with AHSA1/START domain